MEKKSNRLPWTLKSGLRYKYPRRSIAQGIIVKNAVRISGFWPYEISGYRVLFGVVTRQRAHKYSKSVKVDPKWTTGAGP
jgi:hypothetical protein